MNVSTLIKIHLEADKYIFEEHKTLVMYILSIIFTPVDKSKVNFANRKQNNFLFFSLFFIFLSWSIAQAKPFTYLFESMFSHPTDSNLFVSSWNRLHVPKVKRKINQVTDTVKDNVKGLTNRINWLFEYFVHSGLSFTIFTILAHPVYLW